MTATDVSVRETAIAYANSGLSVLPIKTDGSKEPPDRFSWKHLQQTAATAAQVTQWFQQPYAIALIGGEASGGLQILDFDVPGKREEGFTPQDAPMFGPWCELVREYGLGDLLATLPIVRTKSGGFHVYIRSDECGKCGKLAYPKEGTEATIEIKATGGYAVTAPSPGYELIQGDLTNIPTITPDERDQLLNFARFLDEREPELQPEPAHSQTTGNKGDRPGDDFNARATWEQTELETAGWRRTGGLYQGKQMWTRPGKIKGTSAISGPGTAGEYFYCFSPNGHPIPQNKALSKFSLYTILNHGGNLSREAFSEAAKALRAKGYGKPATRQPKPKEAYVPIDEGHPNHPPEFKLTDWGNGERLIHHHGKNLRWCHLWGCWMTWDDVVWQQDETGGALVRQYAADTARMMLEEATRLESTDARAALAKHATKSESSTAINNMITEAKAQPGVPVTPKDLDTNPYLFATQNGTFDLKTMTSRKSNRADLITRQMAVDYNPEAKCPRWDTFLKEVFPNDPNLPAYMQKLVGYALSGRTDQHFFHFFYGAGSNGKSKVTDTLRALFGRYGERLNTDSLMAKFGDQGVPNDLAKLVGTRLVFATETTAGKRFNEQLMKSLTGGDSITARFLHKEWFEFKPTFQLIISGNHRPEIKGTDHGMWRRVRLVPFTETFDPETEPTLEATLLSELEGILVWAIKGYAMFEQDGLAPTKSMTEANTEYREASDVIGRFLDECTTYDQFADAGQGTGAGKVYESYKTWTEETNERAESENKFSAAMKERGKEKVKTRTGKIYTGLLLISDIAAQTKIDNTYRGD